MSHDNKITRKAREVANLALAQADLHDKLRLANLYAALMVRGGLTDQEIMDFETALSEQFEAVFESDSGSISEATSEGEVNSVNTLHIISEPLSTGGHTRLCENLGRIEGGASDLLITRAAQPEALNRISACFSQVYVVGECEDLTGITQIFEIVKNYSTVVLHIHPNDILATIALHAAVKKVKRLKVYFVNHADHVCSHGKSVANVILQVSSVGYERAKENDVILDKSSFMGIPVRLPPTIKLKPQVSKFVIAGSSQKTKPTKEPTKEHTKEPTKQLSLQRHLADLLSSNKAAELVVIGVSPVDYWWWWLRLRFYKRVTCYPQMNHEQYLRLVQACDACIDTSPVTGGTAFVEMFSRSLWPIALSGGITGYTPLDKIRSSSLKNPQTYGEAFFMDLYEEVKLINSMDTVGKRYFDAMKGIYHPLPDSLVSGDAKSHSFNRIFKILVDNKNVLDITRLSAVSLLWKVGFLLGFASLPKSLVIGFRQWRSGARAGAITRTKTRTKTM